MSALTVCADLRHSVRTMQFSVETSGPGFGISTLFVIGVLFWLFCIVDVANKQTKDPADRIAWLLVVLLLPVLGAVLYLCFSNIKEDEEKKAGRRGVHTEQEVKDRANSGTLL